MAEKRGNLPRTDKSKKILPPDQQTPSDTRSGNKPRSHYRILTNPDQSLSSDKPVKAAQTRVYSDRREPAPLPLLPADRQLSTWSENEITLTPKSIRRAPTVTATDFHFRFDEIRCRLQVLLSRTSDCFSEMNNHDVIRLAFDMKSAFETAYRDPRLCDFWHGEIDEETFEFSNSFSKRQVKFAGLKFDVRYTMQCFLAPKAHSWDFQRESLPALPTEYQKQHIRIAKDICRYISNILLVKDSHAPDTSGEVSANAVLVADILDAWRSDTSLSNDTLLTQSVQKKLAEQAALVAEQTLAAQTSHQNLHSDKVVDPVSGLELPPKLKTPYRERGHHKSGKRLDVFEHLRNEYGEYLDANLLYSGHINEIDPAAYKALIYLARKQAALEDEAGAVHSPTQRFLQSHGIITADQLESPPDHLQRPVAIINQARGRLLASKMRGVSRD